MTAPARSAYIDISPPLTDALPVWPGDRPLLREVLLDRKRGDNVTLSALHATVHLGAHADAPSHFGLDAASIETCALETYVGPCQVVRVPLPKRGLLTPELLPAAVIAPRLLIATGTYQHVAPFQTDFAALAAALIEWLSAQQVRLVGVDTPSVDLFDSHDLPAHNACLAHGVSILECLDLAGVPEGLYELIALPLRLVGFDASPVRAVLRRLEE